MEQYSKRHDIENKEQKQSDLDLLTAEEIRCVFDDI